MPERDGSPAATPSRDNTAAAEVAAAAHLTGGAASSQPAGSPIDAGPRPPSVSEDAQASGDVPTSSHSNASVPDGNEGKEEEEETCGFCIFMKAGGCKTSFDDWSKCVDTERGKGNDYPNDCREQTFALRECMLQHKEYYAPLLQDEVDFVADKQEEDEHEAAAAVGR